MDSAQFQRVRALFHAACELPPDERPRYLDAACREPGLRREVEALLEADGSQQNLLRAPEALGERLLNRTRGSPETLPSRIGRYRVLERIGAGGMGEILKAEQEAPRRVVAIKLIRAGLATPSMLRRFELEAHVLGRLQHPCIAQIFEAGIERLAAADGRSVERPYLVMEFVPGLPLRTHAANYGLDVRQRVALLARVCDGVHHAHQRGIIHRDLKPANILVIAEPEGAPGTQRADLGTAAATAGPPASGLPKILDFGIARTLEDDSGVTAEMGLGLLGTLPYMSPEQVSGAAEKIDIRTDVYALGVMLYELLAEHLPFDVAGLNVAEAARRICETAPPPLSSWNRALRGDLESIVHKALHAQRAQRYQSAAELAEDLRRYLAGEPILARAASALYRVQQGLRRYRTALFVALGLVGVSAAFAGFLALSLARQAALLDETVAARDAEAEARGRAERERERAQAISDFLRDMLTSADPARSAGRDARLSEYLDRAARELDEDALAARPDVEALLRVTLGKTYHALGLVAEAERHLDAALQLTGAAYGEQSAESAAVLNSLGAMYRARGDYGRAAEACRRVVEIVRASRGPDHQDYAVVLGELADVYRAQSEFAAAEACGREQLGVLARLVDPDPVVLVTAHVKLGQCLAAQQQEETATAEFETGVALATERLGRQHPWTAFALEAYGAMLARRPATHGRAVELLDEALVIRRAVMPPGHPDTAQAAVNLADALARTDPARALPLLEEAVEIFATALGEQDVRLSVALEDLATLHDRLGSPEHARMLYERALGINRVVFGNQHPRVAGTLHNCGAMLFDVGDYAAAEPYLREAWEIRQTALPENDAAYMNVLCVYAQTLYELGRFVDAEPLAAQCFAVRQRALPAGHPTLPRAQALWGKVLLSLHRLDEAETALRGAFEAVRGDERCPVARRQDILTALVQLYTERGDAGAAERWRSTPATTQAAMP